VTAYEAGGRDGPLPSLLHTANSSKVEFVLAGVAPRGNGSRFVLEVATVEETGAAQKLRSARSIDDEYTPTIFEVSVGRAPRLGTSRAAGSRREGGAGAPHHGTGTVSRPPFTARRSPSLPQMLSLVAESRNDSSALSFLQWKATAYGSRTPRREDNIQCRAHGLQAANWTLPASSLVRAYFGEGAGSAYTVSALNISFGGEDGKVYQEKRYLSW